MASSVPPPSFAIKGFRIAGDNPLGETATQALLAPYVKPNATLDTLQQAAAALEKALRDRGFGLHRVALPPQEVGDTVTLNIVKFTIARVEIEGASLYDAGNIRRAVPELREGHTPNFGRMAVQTAIANENPNKQVQVGLKESSDIDKIDVTIAVKEQKPWNVGVGISNAGTSNSGRDRFTVTGSHTNVFNLDHQFIGAYTTSIERPGDVRQIGLSYKAPLYELGGVAGASFTRSDVVGNFGAFTSTGAGHTFGVSYTHYLPPQGGHRSYITFGLDDRLFEATEISGVTVGVNRRSRPVSVGYTSRVESDKATYGWDVAFAMNTGSGAYNDLFSYQQEDPRIDTVRWKALRGNANYAAPFATGWFWSARASWQYSPDVLISGEQFGLGGLGSVRGTDIDRPISGDSGTAASLEVNTPELARGLRALAFVDAGWLANNDPNGVTRLSSDRLASVGLGLRYTLGSLSLSLDYGRIVMGSRIPVAVNATAPKRGDDRFYVSALFRF